jgi:hypothetical protein
MASPQAREMCFQQQAMVAAQAAVAKYISNANLSTTQPWQIYHFLPLVEHSCIIHSHYQD